ncbi:hypothetical protein [Aeromicrobium sp. UC242_57]|uniref:hypothetical protein n=1 Tax=Aeromicrobium sp. UC242_57 TaxID=3374624 RepID=UPI0037BA2FFD
MHRTRIKLTAAVASGLLVAVGASACASDATSDAESSADSGSSASSSDEAVAAAQVVVDQALSADKTYPKPPGDFDPGKKKAVVIAQGFAIPVIQAMSEEAVTAYRAMGWDVGQPLDGALNPATFGGQVDQAVQDKADAITLVSAPLTPVKAAIQRAIDAGVAVTCVNCDIPADVHGWGWRTPRSTSRSRAASWRPPSLPEPRARPTWSSPRSPRRRRWSTG